MAVRELGLDGIEVFGRGILPGRLGRTVGGVITARSNPRPILSGGFRIFSNPADLSS